MKEQGTENKIIRIREDYFVLSKKRKSIEVKMREKKRKRKK